MKEYLQLEGLAYKLVPIKTENNRVFNLGRINPEKMYANIKKIDWKNINDGKIYLDEQTKKNAISLRNNLMRLSEEFAKKGDTIKQGQLIGLVGDTGRVTGPHLHYEIWLKGKRVDPLLVWRSWIKKENKEIAMNQ